MSIEIGIGMSWQADVREAGCQAAEEAISHLAGRRPDVTLVFSSIRFADPRLLKGIRSVTGQAPLVGCTDAGGISTSGPKRRCVTVVALIAHGGRFITGLGRQLSQDPAATGQALIKELFRDAPPDPRAVLLFPDGLSGNGAALVRSAKATLPQSVPIVGGFAADDFFFQKTFQFYNDDVLTDSVPGVLLTGDVLVGIGVRHGWIPLGRPRRITRSAGHVIHQLDRKPAVAIYEDYLGMKRGELLSESLGSMTITYPLGVTVPGQEEYLLRDALRVGRQGSLICTGDLPEGSSVQLMIGGYESALEAAQQAAHEAGSQIGQAQVRGALIFSSVARQKMLGSEFQGEIDVIRDALGGSGVRMGGFYGYGEVAPPQSKRRAGTESVFHNESVVVMALG